MKNILKVAILALFMTSSGLLTAAETTVKGNTETKTTVDENVKQKTAITELLKEAATAGIIGLSVGALCSTALHLTEKYTERCSIIDLIFSFMVIISAWDLRDALVESATKNQTLSNSMAFLTYFIGRWGTLGLLRSA